jgi:hypothetical protein
MSRRRRKVDHLRIPKGADLKLMNLAAELGGEDGGDAKEFYRKPWNAPKQASR